MRASLIALAIVACAACDVAGPVVDQLPKPPAPPVDDGRLSVPCYEPPSCEPDFVLESEVTALRSLDADISGLDEDAGIEEVLEPDAIDWAGESIVLASASPIEIVLDDAPEAGTLIELRGPVTLRFRNIASLEGLRIAGPSPESRLVLEHVTALDMTLGDSDHRFAGRVEAKHTAFERASVNAAHVQLDSAAFIDSFIAADKLVSRDVLMKKVVLEVGDGLFAPTEVREAEIRRCDALSFFGSTLRNVSIPRCLGDAPTRFYATDVYRGVIDGLLSADTSSMEAVRIGRKEKTSLLMWRANVINVTFCDLADDLQLEPGAAQCSGCTDDALEGLVCELSRGEPDDSTSSSDPRNFCERLDEAPRCQEPLPERLRPHGGEE